MAENIPGKSTRQMASGRRAIRRKLGVLGFGVLAEVIFFYWWIPIAIAFPLAMVGLWAADHFFIGWMDDAFKREGDATRGAAAEETVGEVLNRLPVDCMVLHDVRANFGNIDHIVLRKDGAVFLIETKSQRGTINQWNARNFLAQTHRNIFWLQGFLRQQLGVKPWISAAIVFPNANVRMRRPLRGVDFMSADYLSKWVAKASGNHRVAQKLWSQMESIKSELLNPPPKPGSKGSEAGAIGRGE